MDNLWWIQFEELCKKTEEMRLREEARQREEAAAEYERHVAEYHRYMAAYERCEAKAAAAAEAERIAEEECAAVAERDAEALSKAECATTVKEAELEVVPEAEGVVASKVPAIQEKEETECAIFVQNPQIGSPMVIPAPNGGELEFVRVAVPPIGDFRFAMLQIKYLGFVVSPIIVDFEIDGGRRPPRKPPDVFLPGGFVRVVILPIGGSGLCGFGSCLMDGGRPLRKPPDSAPCGGGWSTVPCFLETVQARRPPAKPPDTAEVQMWFLGEGFTDGYRNSELEPAEPFSIGMGPAQFVQSSWALQKK